MYPINDIVSDLKTFLKKTTLTLTKLEWNIINYYAHKNKNTEREHSFQQNALKQNTRTCVN